MKNKEKIATTILIALSLAAFLSSCTKKKEMKNDVGPSAYIDKADLTGCPASTVASGCANQKVFSLVKSVVDAQGENPFWAVPGFHEDMGAVTFRITEKSLELVSKYDNITHAPEVVMSFPISGHFNIVQQKNEYGETTNQIVEEQKGDWKTRQFMRVDWSSPSYAAQVGEGVSDNSISIEQPLAKEKDGVMSLTTRSQKTFEGSWRSFDVVTKTYFIERKNRQFVQNVMSLDDFKKFGFFMTKDIRSVTPGAGLLDKNVIRKANIFDVCESSVQAPCAKNQIVYHVSKGMPSKFKDLSRQVINEWNQVFKKELDRNDDVVVFSEDEVDFSDSTVNSIAYYPHETSAGLLGVSQIVTDEFSGETLSARSTIYQDGIDYTLASVDLMMDLLLVDENSLRDFLKSGSLVSTTSQLLAKSEKAISKSRIRFESGKSNRTKFNSSILSNTISLARANTDANNSVNDAITARPEKYAIQDKAILSILAGSDEANSQFKDSLVAHANSQTVKMLGGQKLFAGDRNMQKLMNALNDSQARFKNTQKKALAGIHEADLVSDAATRYIQRELSKILKRDINEVNLDAVKAALQDQSIRAQIKEDVEKLTFYTTALHEVGHNFGLRHNFHASADESHFHPKFNEIKQKLAAGDKSVVAEDLEPYKYSSVMDYGAAFFDAEGGLGPYDSAAIRFGYRRTLNKQADPIALAGFQFCTDEHVGEDILCRRFDVGSNVSQSTLDLIGRYNRGYATSHFRRGRAGFDHTAWGVPDAMLERYFIPIRQVMDEFLYQLVMSPSASGGCESQFMNDAIARGEIINLCSEDEKVQAEMEMLGVDPNKIETWANGLMKISKEGISFRKDPAAYKANGMADLLFANTLAQDFFTSILGAIEPGTYLAMPSEDGSSSLTKVPLETQSFESAASYDAAVVEGLKKLSAKIAPGMPADAFAKAAMNLVTRVEPGLVGRQLESTIDANEKLQVIGYEWDKALAVLTLAYRNIGVRKYLQASLSSNAYFAPQTKKWASNLIGKLMNKDEDITTVQVKLRNGDVVDAKAPAALNMTTEMYGMLVGTRGFISNTNRAFAENLRLTDEDNNSCLRAKSTIGQAADNIAVAKFGQTSRLCAAQSKEGDSVVFKMVRDAEIASLELSDAVTAATQPQKLKTELEQVSKTTEVLRNSLDTAMKAVPELAKVVAALTDVSDKAKSASALLSTAEKSLDSADVNVILQIRGGAAKLIAQSYATIDLMVIELAKKAGSEVTPPQDKRPAIIRNKFVDVTSSLLDSKDQMVASNLQKGVVLFPDVKTAEDAKAKLAQIVAVRQLLVGKAPEKEIQGLLAGEIARINLISRIKFSPILQTMFDTILSRKVSDIKLFKSNVEEEVRF